MRAVAEQIRAAASASRSFNPAGARIPAEDRPTLPRWCAISALVVGFVAAFMSPAGRDVADVAQLERVAPKIERAQALSPEARETINRLIARQSTAARWEDPSRQVRRKGAVERVTSAMQAKEGIAAVNDVAASDVSAQ